VNPDSRPILQFTNLERYAAVDASQFFLPYASIRAKVSAFWNMDETSGNFLDATVNGLDLVNNNSVGSNGGGILGNAAQFVSASNQSLSVTNNVFKADGSFTFWCWARRDTAPSFGVLMAKSNGDAINTTSLGEYWLYWNFGSASLQFHCNVAGSDAPLVGPALPEDGKLHFVACWYDAVNHLLGVQVDMGVAVTGSTGGAISTSTFPFQLGGFGNTRGWQGLIDAAGFAKGYVLSNHELNLIYAAGVGRQWPL
jgi:hypothetical protein